MKWDSILNIREYRSPESLREHPRMERAERAKIFSPFAALRGYDDSIQEEIHKAELCRRPLLTDSEKASIDGFLRNTGKGDHIKATVFREESNGYGTIEEIYGYFIKAEPESKRIMIRQDSGINSVPLESLIRMKLLKD